MKKVTIGFLFVLLLSVRNLNAQGCSDAGVCSIHSFKNNAEAHESKEGKKNDLSVGFGYGIGERSTDNYTWYAEYTRTITKRTSVTGTFLQP